MNRSHWDALLAIGAEIGAEVEAKTESKSKVNPLSDAALLQRLDAAGITPQTLTWGTVDITGATKQDWAALFAALSAAQRVWSAKQTAGQVDAK